MIYVTKPDLPPLEEYTELLKEIWDSGVLTNDGPFHQQFEQKIADFLGVKYCSLFCNGMSALQIGLLALRITRGEVITTPYSFVATTHAVHWNACTPVFCDIKDDFTIDPAQIEKLITPETTAILPVHVYGIPCDTDAINSIAASYGLKVLYDAAHCFGVKRNGQSIMSCGDLSMISFHATKAFNTAEGGALLTNNPNLKKRIDYLKNFGFADETTVVSPGANGKMNELQAALGILQLKYFSENKNKTMNIFTLYKQLLADVEGIKMLDVPENVDWNYSYCPVLINNENNPDIRDFLYETLKTAGYYCRRYFYPLINEFSPYKNLATAKSENLPLATKISGQVLCLPLYSDLDHEHVYKICEIIKQNLPKG